MFKSKTLFIVGAGASCEVGLPSGAELKAKIADRLDIKFADGYSQSSGDRKIVEALRKHVKEVENNRDINPYLGPAWQIKSALPLALSIDNYIDAHRGDKKIELCGKLGIVSSIIASEKDSRLYFNERNSEKFDTNLKGAWYAYFFQRLTENVDKSRVGEIFKNVSIVTFNYDRCIEHFLKHSLAIYYGLDDREAEEIISTLVILHPYGQVGYLPWQRNNQRATVGFGGTYSGDFDLLAVAGQIKTFTEQFEEGDALKTIRDEVAEAEVIVFLGFAFADQNMELLNPNRPTKAKRAYATAYRVSASDREVINEKIGELLSRTKAFGSRDWTDLDLNIRSDLKCSELFEEYWRSMVR
jgi:hypothetical protein